LQYYISISDSTLYKKIASNTIAQIISKALTAIISIFLIGILTKYLPIELYWSYNKIYSYLGIFAFLADLWLYTITIREISRAQTAPEKIIGNVLSLRTWLWVIIIFIALAIAYFLPWYNDFYTLLAIAIVWVFTLVSLINSAILALMQSQLKMEFSLISVVSGKLITLVLIAYFLIFMFDASQNNIAFISVFIAGFLWVLVNTLLNYNYAKKFIDIRYRFDLDYISYIFKTSLPYWLALFLSVVYFKIDVILLSLLESPEQADISIALYWLPMKIIEVLMVLGWFYLNSLLPSLTQKYKSKNYISLWNMLWISLKILFSFGLLIFALWNLFWTEVIRIIATPEYLDPISSLYSSLDAFRIVLAVLMFYFVSLSFIYMLIASEKQGILLWINSWVTALNIIGNIILIPYYSFYWAAIVTLVSQILLTICTAIIVLKTISFPMKYVHSMVLWAVGMLIIYMIFDTLKWLTNFNDIINICFYTPLFLLLYAWWEFIFSKNLRTNI